MQRQAILWGRFSSDQQKDGDSKDRQERLNREFAKREGIQVVAEYFDPATSVKDGATPLFKKVISELPDGVGIVCENLDRISRGKPWRSKAMLLDIIEDGHFIITSQDGREYNETTIEEIDTLLLGDLSTNLARMENNKRTKRVKEAKASAVELSRQGKPAPLGCWLPKHLKYNPKTKEYDIDEDKKAFFNKLFTDYANGKGVQTIAKELNEKGIPTFKFNRTGGWQKSTVFAMLRYEGLIGVFNYNPNKDKIHTTGERIVNAWPAAISEKLFYEVQAKLKINKSKHGNYKSKKVLNILRGISKCSHCGSTMTVTVDNYLGCSGHFVGRCGIKNMLADYVNTEIDFATWFVPMAKDALLGKDDSTVSIDALTTKKDALNGKIEAMVSLLDSAIAANAAKKQLDKLGIELSTIENEIATIKANTASQANMPEHINELKTIIAGIKDNQEIRKRVSEIIPNLVSRVEIDLENKWFPSFNVILTNGKTITWTQTNLGKNKEKSLKAMGL